jgi:hypothetical protein
VKLEGRNAAAVDSVACGEESDVDVTDDPEEHEAMRTAPTQSAIARRAR